MRVIIPNLSYQTALKNAVFQHFTKEVMNSRASYFYDIACNVDNKLPYLLPPKANSIPRRLRNNRTFELTRFRTELFKNSFLMHYAHNLSMKIVHPQFHDQLTNRAKISPKSSLVYTCDVHCNLERDKSCIKNCTCKISAEEVAIYDCFSTGNAIWLRRI